MYAELKAIASGEAVRFHGSADILAIHSILCPWYQCHQRTAVEAQEVVV